MTTTTRPDIAARIATAQATTHHPPVPAHVKSECHPHAVQHLGKISPASAGLYCLLAELKAELVELKQVFPVDGAATDINLREGGQVAELLQESVGADFGIEEGNVALYGDWQAVLLPQKRTTILLLGGPDAQTLAALLNGQPVQ